MSVGIPSVDLADFKNGSAEDKAAFVQKLGQAYEAIGFVAVRNHNLDEALSKRLYSSAQSFYALDPELKSKYRIEGLAGQRGYTSFGTEHAKNSKVGDLKEFFHFGQDIENAKDEDFTYPENVYVEEVPEFNKAGMEAFKALEESGKYLLRAIALYLGLDEFYFDERIYYGNSILRPIHYSPITSEPKNAVRAGQHEDINLITLLMGASADGLQILNKQEEWVAVTALPDQIVVNVGDMLERLTNNKLKSTTHRVVNPPREKWGESRYSIPFFLHPRSEVSLRCLDSCVSDSNPKAYDDITAGEFLNQRLIEIGLIKK